ncbi:81cdc667-a2df-413c-8007-005872e296f3 [Thermothielavioides terrestris]
MIIVV